MNDPSSLRSGFVTILGRPNAGKSTMLNALAGSKIAIVSAKPQTTRTALSGVVTLDRDYPYAAELLRRHPEFAARDISKPYAQIIFLDTPGIQDPKTRLDQQMMEEGQRVLVRPLQVVEKNDERLRAVAEGGDKVAQGGKEAPLRFLRRQRGRRRLLAQQQARIGDQVEQQRAVAREGHVESAPARMQCRFIA